MKFRKKPIEVEAEQYLVTGKAPKGICFKPHDGIQGGPHVHTLEGTSYEVKIGEWIICGIKGEFYPCKPDIFEATYEKVAPNK